MKPGVRIPVADPGGVRGEGTRGVTSSGLGAERKQKGLCNGKKTRCHGLGRVEEAALPQFLDLNLRWGIVLVWGGALRAPIPAGSVPPPTYHLPRGRPP